MKSKQINKFLLMFFLSFTLFFSVSYAEFSITPLDNYASFSGSSDIGTNSCGDYTFNQVKSIIYNRFINESDSYIAVFDAMVESLSADGIKLLVVRPKSAEDNYLMFVGNSNISIGAYTNTSDQLSLYFAQIDSSIKNGEVNRIRKISVTDSSSTYATSVLVDGSPNFGFDTKLNYTIAYSNIDIKKIVYSGGPTWDGTSYFYKAHSSEPEVPALTDDELADIINIFLTSEDLINNRPSGYNDYYIIYDNVAAQYYAYLYKSSLHLAMRYGDWDDNDNFSFNGLSSGEGYRIFHHSFEGDLNFVQELWATISEHLSNSKYYCFRINPEVNKCHYITAYTDDVLYYATSQRNIVYSTKEISLLVGTGVSGTTVDTGNSIPPKTLIDSSTGEEYEFEMPSISVSDTPWNRFISVILEIPNHLIEKLQSINGFKTMISFAFPLITGITTIIGVLISSIALISRAVTFVYTLPTIEASSALFSVDVAETTNGLSFGGHSWGARFLEGLDMLRNFSWNGLNLWNLFSAFIAAMFAIQVVKYVRKHYHY